MDNKLERQLLDEYCKQHSQEYNDNQYHQSCDVQINDLNADPVSQSMGCLATPWQMATSTATGIGRMKTELQSFETPGME